MTYFTYLHLVFVSSVYNLENAYLLFILTTFLLGIPLIFTTNANNFSFTKQQNWHHLPIVTLWLTRLGPQRKFAFSFRRPISIPIRTTLLRFKTRFLNVQHANVFFTVYIRNHSSECGKINQDNIWIMYSLCIRML